MGVAKTLSNYLLPLMLNPTMALCEIQLFNAPNSTDHYAQYDSMGAQFGDSIPDEGLFGIVQLANPIDACDGLNNTDIPETSQGEVEQFIQSCSSNAVTVNFMKR